MFVQERREYAKLSPSLRALVLQRLCEANMEARDHVRTWMTDDTEVDDLRCEVRSSQTHTAIDDLWTRLSRVPGCRSLYSINRRELAPCHSTSNASAEL